MKVLAMLCLSLLLLAGCPLKGGGTTPQPAPKLKMKPTNLTVIEVPGAQLVISERFRVFIVEDDGALDKNTKVDRAALEAKAGECASGGSCGRKMSDKEVKAFYQSVEGATWARGHLAGAEAADAQVQASGAARIMLFAGAQQDLREVTRQVFLPGGYCDPGGRGGVQPQCPPPPLPPRFPDLDSIAVPLSGQ